MKMDDTMQLTLYNYIKDECNKTLKPSIVKRTLLQYRKLRITNCRLDYWKFWITSCRSHTACCTDCSPLIWPSVNFLVKKKMDLRIFLSRLSMIVRVNMVLNRTVVDSDVLTTCAIIIFRVKVSWWYYWFWLVSHQINHIWFNLLKHWSEVR